MCTNVHPKREFHKTNPIRAKACLNDGPAGTYDPHRAPNRRRRRIITTHQHEPTPIPHGYGHERGNERIQIFDSSGSFVKMMGYGVQNGSSVFQVCTHDCESGIAGDDFGQFAGRSSRSSRS